MQNKKLTTAYYEGIAKSVFEKYGEVIRALGDKSWTQEEEDKFQRDLKQHLKDKRNK